MAVAAVLDGEALTLGRVRITWTGGPSPLGSDRGDGPPTLVVVSAPMDPWPDTTAVATVPWPRNERGALAGLKTTSYGENVRALARAREQGASEAVFANLQGHLCEGTGTNVFYVVDGDLRTPTLAAGCLAGITRHLVLEWYGATEVDEPIEVLAGGQRSVPRLHHPRRPAHRAVGRQRPRGARPGHHRGPEGVARARGRPARSVTTADVVRRGPCAKVSVRSHESAEQALQGRLAQW